MFFFGNGAPPPTRAASPGPANRNSEVYRDTINNVSARRDENVATTVYETSAAPAVCETRVTV